MAMKLKTAGPDADTGRLRGRIDVARDAVGHCLADLDGAVDRAPGNRAVALLNGHLCEAASQLEGASRQLGELER